MALSLHLFSAPAARLRHSNKYVPNGSLLSERLDTCRGISRPLLPDWGWLRRFRCGRLPRQKDNYPEDRHASLVQAFFLFPPLLRLQSERQRQHPDGIILGTRRTLRYTLHDAESSDSDPCCEAGHSQQYMWILGGFFGIL